MILKDEIKENAKKEVILFCEKIKRHPLRFLIHILRILILISISIVIIWALIELPRMGVSHFNINNTTDKATIENQYRATIAQILGGVAIGISLYYTYKRVSATEKSIIIAQESQITERFTRAVDQLGAIDHLGNPALEIRLGGIYALERISTESEKDCWPIMEILTAYVRKNSSNEIVENKKATHLAMDIQANESITSEVQKIKKVTLDIQAILTVIGRRNKSFKNEEINRLDLQGTCLQEANLNDANLNGANLVETHLERAHLWGTHLEGADLFKAHLEEANLAGTHLERANLAGTHLERANLAGTHLEGATFVGTHLERANLMRTHLEGANLMRTHLEGANLAFANLEGTKNLTINQLSKAKTLYKATGFNNELEISLREKYPGLFEIPK